MQRKTTWWLTCDASRAHIFSEHSPGRAFEHVASFEHPESRARTSDLVTDTNGRKPVGGSHGGGVNGNRPGGFHGLPGAAPDTEPKDVEAQKFAREITAELARGLDAHAYDALVVAAPPRFLGLLKQTLGDQVTKRLEATIDKDFSALAPREIERRLRAERAA
jgi:hypothetical protein